MIRNILVPTDGSPFSHQAIEPAVDLARRANARLHVVRVHEPLWASGYATEVPAFDVKADAAIRREEEELLAELGYLCERRWSIRPTTQLLEAPVIGALDEYIRSHAIDLVIMTTHGRGGINRALLGSVADGLIQVTEVPLLLIRPREDLTHAALRLNAHHVLIPLDESELAEAVVGPATDVAKLIGARFTLLRVSQPVRDVATLSGKVPVMGAELRARPNDYLERIAARLRAEGVTVDTAVYTHTNVAQGILDYAATHAVDAIAMATHGRGSWYRIVLGSVARSVMRDVMMPMIVYHPAHADSMVSV
jgi:nucleotide-binding universal stress UspA family protein